MTPDPNHDANAKAPQEAARVTDAIKLLARLLARQAAAEAQRQGHPSEEDDHVNKSPQTE